MTLYKQFNKCDKVKLIYFYFLCNIPPISFKENPNLLSHHANSSRWGEEGITQKGKPLRCYSPLILKSAFLVTIPTVYRSGSIGFEGNLSFFSTFCASYFMHFTRASIKPSSFFVFSIHVTSFLLFVSFWHKAKAYKHY